MRFRNKIDLTPGSIAMLLALLTGPALAQENAPAETPATTKPAITETEPIKKDDVTLFGEFLDQNPNIEARLRENTALIDDGPFLKNHPQLFAFLEQHPRVRSELATKPRWFLHREFVRQSTPPVTPEQLAEFDRFLDEHPDLAKQLSRNPQLLVQTDFFNHQPALQDYVRRHPEIHRTTTILRPPSNLIRRTVPTVPPVKRPDLLKTRPKGKL